MKISTVDVFLLVLLIKESEKTNFETTRKEKENKSKENLKLKLKVLGWKCVKGIKETFFEKKSRELSMFS